VNVRYATALGALALLLAIPIARGANSGAQVAAPCAACHGQRGEGLAASGYPRLAGQPAEYLAKQLRDFTSDARESAVMSPLAKILSEKDIAEVSDYYARLNARAPASKNAATSKLGSMLATLGDAKLGVQGCGNCHGPKGRGEPPTLPYLAGQHAAYVSAQLQAWKSGTRKNDAGEQMATVAKKLNDADIAAVAEYFASQSAPTP
jgi:cytochrome c553